MRVPSLAAAAALALACLPAAAQSLKPGLWEIHNKMSGNAEMDQAMAEMQKQLAAMPPEQRQQLEAMMAQRGVARVQPGAGGGMAAQTCMTREMVERNEVPMQDGCRMTQNSRSGNTVKMAFTCASPPSGGEGTFTFNGSEAYTSRMTVRSVVDGKPQAVTMEATGKWLKADCGNVKPPASVRK